ncbi:hypothetical protein CBW65_01635 [Tumebacillus avium]|uniref:Uncharacterized protein n=2 Tax=Tumebacillus avium TaxID=1903704 RepID=A0A1Y0ISX7_9BACL|nr:hypothetical protein CBW65_01635 [Tumebacillus avium]
MRRRLVLILLLFSVLLTGCFGAREIDQLALVTAVGIDKGSKDGLIKVTTQIARPGDVRGQTGSPAAGTGEPIWTASAEGESIFAAIRNLARYSSRRIFWAHNQVIIISEDVARDGITDVIDFFSRNHELRMRTWVVVTPGKAWEVVATKTGLEIIPGVSIDKVFRYSDIVSEAPRTDMRTLSAAFLSESTHPVLAKIQARSRQISADRNSEFGTNPQIEMAGTAVFKRDKMVGWLNLEQSRGLLWFIHKVQSRVIALDCGGGKPLSLEIKNNSFQVTPLYQNSKVSFQIKLHAEIDLVELGCSPDQSQIEIMQQLEPHTVELLTHEVQSVIEAAQKTYGVDILELGKVFQNRYPSEWQMIKKDWDQVFPEAEVSVKVDVHIGSPVLLSKPMRPGK